MSQDLDNCPACRQLLVFPRNGLCYCEDCGWPDEDETQEFTYPRNGEQLGDFQPFLEFYNGTSWVISGVECSSMIGAFRGLYRYPYKGHLEE